MTNPTSYQFESNSLEAPALNSEAITTSDGTDLTTPTRAIYVGGSGTITVDMVGVGSNITFSGAVAGTILPLRVSRVYTTNTSATNLVALY